MTKVKTVSSCSRKGSEAHSRGRPREFDMDKALDAAMEVFWRKGYMQTTLRDLCKAMSITPPSFYCAFGSRENIFLSTLRHYKKIYWDPALKNLMDTRDPRSAFKSFLEEAVRIFIRPNLPKGCFIDISMTGMSRAEARILQELEVMERGTLDILRKCLSRAVETGQIPPDAVIPDISGSFYAFLKGVSTLARGDISQPELTRIALRGLLLIPFQENSSP